MPQLARLGFKDRFPAGLPGIIETDCDPCDAQFDYPITAEDIDTLINTDFAHVLRIQSIIRWYEDDIDIRPEEEYSLREFIATKLTPEQQSRVMEHFWAEIDKIHGLFPRS